MSAQRVIGVDLGGTKILTASLDGDGQVVRETEVATPTGSQAELLEAIAASVEAVRGDGFDAVGFGLPSIIDRRAGRIVGSINIPLSDFPLEQAMAERFGVPVAVENDANVAALAEWRAGAARGAHSLVLLTLGTGVGGGVVVGGALFREWAELGHVVVTADGPPCQGACTGRGHLEAVASGSAADRLAEQLWGEGATAELLTGRANEGDAEAIEALAQMGHLLGVGIGSFVNIFAPELVVVGGGFGLAAFDHLVPAALEAARREALPPARDDLRIVRAELGERAGVIGAGLLALDELGAG